MIHILKFDLDGNLFVKSDWYILDPELDFGSISPFEIIQAHGSLYVVGMKIIQNDPEIAAEISGIFAKYNPENCEKEWNIWVTDYDNIIINSVTESDNGVYICGNIAINQMTVESTIVVGKYNSDGNQQWFKKYEWDNSKPAFKIDYLVNLRNIFNSILKIYFHKL